MATGIYSWSQTAASNNSADSTISYTEGQAPSSINDSARAAMAVIAKWRDDMSGVTTGNAILTTGGSANAHTLTTNISIGALTNGWTVTFKAGFSNTAACTINVDSKGAKSIYAISGTALVGGELVAGSVYTVTYHQPVDSWLLHSYFRTPAQVLLTSGTVSSAATKDLVLTPYTAYRALKFILTGFSPVTADVTLIMETSTDAGSSYETTDSYNYAGVGNDTTTQAPYDWSVTPASNWAISSLTGNSSTDAVNAEITLYNHTSTAFYTQAQWDATSVSSTGATYNIRASGRRINAGDTDAVRFLFSSGNISAGKYAVHGLT